MRQQRNDYREQMVQRSIKKKAREQPERLPPIRLQQHIPVSRRNGPCPYHPEFKFKRCPHGCMQRVRQHRDMLSGTVPLSLIKAAHAPVVEQSEI